MEETTQVQVENSSIEPSIEHILHPISYISWLLGVGIAHPRKCPKVVTIIIRIVHLAICSISLAFVIISLIHDQEILSFFDVITNIFSFMYCIDGVTSYMAMYYYIYYGISQYNKWSELINRMKKLDQKIKREISMDDQPVKYVETIAILVVFAYFPLYPIICSVYDCYTQSHSFSSNWWDVLFYYTLAQLLINSFVFDIVVYVFYYRFQMINKLISQLDELSNAQRIALQIRRIREFHNGICDLIVMVNDIHGVQLFLCLMNCITAVITTLFIAYMHLMQKNYFSMIIINIECTLYIIQFGAKCWICTLARQESEKTGIIIYGFLLKCKNLNEDYVRNEINDFSIQLQQYRVAFTACNFLEINNSLFIYFVGVIVTHLLILIQFYKPTKESIKFLKTLCRILLNILK